jgi:hypothetical protein
MSSDSDSDRSPRKKRHDKRVHMRCACSIMFFLGFCCPYDCIYQDRTCLAGGRAGNCAA